MLCINFRGSQQPCIHLLTQWLLYLLLTSPWDTSTRCYWTLSLLVVAMGSWVSYDCCHEKNKIETSLWSERKFYKAKDKHLVDMVGSATGWISL